MKLKCGVCGFEVTSMQVVIDEASKVLAVGEVANGLNRHIQTSHQLEFVKFQRKVKMLALTYINVLTMAELALIPEDEQVLLASHVRQRDIVYESLGIDVIEEEEEEEEEGEEGGLDGVTRVTGESGGSAIPPESL